jgi:hypothetical protein
MNPRDDYDAEIAELVAGLENENRMIEMEDMLGQKFVFTRPYGHEGALCALAMGFNGKNPAEDSKDIHVLFLTRDNAIDMFYILDGLLDEQEKRGFRSAPEALQ